MAIPTICGRLLQGAAGCRRLLPVQRHRADFRGDRQRQDHLLPVILEQICPAGGEALDRGGTPVRRALLGARPAQLHPVPALPLPGG